MANFAEENIRRKSNFPFGNPQMFSLSDFQYNYLI